jgi:hypothetical protein
MASQFCEGKLGALSVIIFLAIIVSAFQYINAKFNRNSMLDGLLRDPANKKAAKAEAEAKGLLKKASKDQAAQVLRDIVGADIPAMQFPEDLLVYKIIMIIMIPLTMMMTMMNKAPAEADKSK